MRVGFRAGMFLQGPGVSHAGRILRACFPPPGSAQIINVYGPPAAGTFHEFPHPGRSPEQVVNTPGSDYIGYKDLVSAGTESFLHRFSPLPLFTNVNIKNKKISYAYALLLQSTRPITLRASSSSPCRVTGRYFQKPWAQKKCPCTRPDAPAPVRY